MSLPLQQLLLELFLAERQRRNLPEFEREAKGNGRKGLEAVGALRREGAQQIRLRSEVRGKIEVKIESDSIGKVGASAALPHWEIICTYFSLLLRGLALRKAVFQKIHLQFPSRSDIINRLLPTSTCSTFSFPSQTPANHLLTHPLSLLFHQSDSLIFSPPSVFVNVELSTASSCTTSRNALHHLSRIPQGLVLGLQFG